MGPYSRWLNKVFEYDIWKHVPLFKNEASEDVGAPPTGEVVGAPLEKDDNRLGTSLRIQMQVRLCHLRADFGLCAYRQGAPVHKYNAI